LCNSVLNELLKEYEFSRIDSNLRLEERKASLYKATPELQKIEDEIISTSISLSKSIISNNDSKHLASLKKKISELAKEKESILKSLGKSKDYLVVNYSCNICKDTGYILNGNTTSMCNCLKQKLFNIQYNKANLSNLDKENFDNFDLKLYSDKPDEQKYGTTLSPRQNMKEIKKCVEDFILNFDNPEQKNLMFSGGTGLGKTFLSNAIVNELLKKGKTVLYQTAPVMLDNIISEMFGKTNKENSISESLLNVDLLVIDDLGTETMNSMKFTELYKIINTRLLNQGKITKTIISTNLDLQHLYMTYDERLVSRFVGHYDTYRFFGDDIRFKLRKN
jgi:DNA replication protein DnaC